MEIAVRCPDHPEKHKRFIATAHVVEEWVVDEKGNFQDTKGVLEVVHRPDPNNYWYCYECGAAAQVTTTEKSNVISLGMH
jgi:hypothetical protein